jgi:hypothetical protein
MKLSTPRAEEDKPDEPDETRRRFRQGLRSGMTLFELTVVIMVLLLMINILLFGARAWKRGSDRTMCIVHIHNVQKGVRAYSNFYGLNPGESTPNLKNSIIGIGRFVEELPICPGGGDYTLGGIYGPDTIPPMGVLYMDCSLRATEQHAPLTTVDW